MDRRQGYFLGQPLAQLLQCKIRLFSLWFTHLRPVRGKVQWFATSTFALRGNVTDSPTPLQELLHHAHANPKSMGNFIMDTLVVVLNSQDTFPEIQGERTHVPAFTSPRVNRLQG